MLSTTVDENSSSTSIVTSSTGSSFCPFSLRSRTFGRETFISNPSRRMVSINTPSCNSPRPPISNASLLSLSANVMATLVSTSASSLSRITVEVTFLPSCPAKGLSFTVMVTDIVGGSIGVEASASVMLGSPIVSATEALVRPAIHIKSPAWTSSTGTRLVPSKRNNFVRRPVSIWSPLRFMAFTAALSVALPCKTRPVRQRPI